MAARQGLGETKKAMAMAMIKGQSEVRVKHAQQDSNENTKMMSWTSWSQQKEVVADGRRLMEQGQLAIVEVG